MSARLPDIEAVYRRRYAAFLRVAVAILGDEPLAHDAVQDGFAHAVRSREQFRAAGSLEGWLWRAVVNAARQRRRGLMRLAEDQVPWPEAPASVPEDHDDDLREAIARLPSRQRLALFLRYYADLDYRAIADALGVAPGTVAASLNTAHETIRQRLLEARSCTR